VPAWAVGHALLSKLALKGGTMIASIRWLLVAVLLACPGLPASAGVLTGTVKDAEGNALEGVLVRVTDDVLGVSESVYTSPKGVYVLATELTGTLKLRARTPYFRDAKTMVEIDPSGTTTEDVVMFPMTTAMEISESLPAAYHFGGLPFESGDDKDFNRYQFQRDCLSCHQMGNPFTRQPRTPESWAVTIERMHRMVGNFDAELRDRRSVILSEGFDGKPVTVRPQFPLDEALGSAKIYEYMLERAFVPHDAIFHPNGLIYTVDQALDHMAVTDPATGQTDYYPQADGRAMEYRKGYSSAEQEVLGEFNPGSRHGPHSLDLRRQDGLYYVTNAGSRSIAEGGVVFLGLERNQGEVRPNVAEKQHSGIAGNSSPARHAGQGCVNFGQAVGAAAGFLPTVS